jgi:membrane peptidoglycan carboxypeptidase
MELISKEDFLVALEEETFSKIIKHQDEIEAPHFVHYVIDQIEGEYGDEYMRTKGLKIITTLDYDMQKEAEKVLVESKSHLAKYGAENASIVVINPVTGEILAMVGSVDFFNDEIDGEVNVAIRPRQPGSSFKPIVYAQAFSVGYQPETVLYDVETNFGPDGTGKEYIPHNYNGGYAGKVSMREALGSSLNIPAVKTLYLGGIDETLDFAEKLGFSTFKERDRYGLSLSLGGGEVELLELVSAYGTFATEGSIVEKTAIKKIEKDSEVFLSSNKKPKNQKINSEVARKINSILSDNQARTLTFGRNNPLVIPGKTVAVKTGTTQDYRDAWTIGYIPSLAVGIWAGNNDNSPMKSGSAGSFVAAPIWNKFMSKQLENLPEEKFNDYDRVKSNKFMVTGNVEESIEFYNNKSGEKLSSPEKKDPEDVREQKTEIPHSILHYVTKGDPLEDDLRIKDPMYGRWEAAVNKGL